MPNPRLAFRYAKSILDLSIEQNALEKTLDDMKLLHRIAEQNQDFVKVMQSPVIKADKKIKIFEAILGNNLSPLTFSFIKLMVTKGREGNFGEIAHAFINLYKENKGIRSLKITSAAPLSENMKSEILRKISGQITAEKIEMETAVNPDLIGGFVVEMEDKLIDASIRRDLNDVKNQFAQNLYINQMN